VGQMRWRKPKAEGPSRPEASSTNGITEFGGGVSGGATVA
jgi:hypothetical protein